MRVSWYAISASSRHIARRTTKLRTNARVLPAPSRRPRSTHMTAHPSSESQSTKSAVLESSKRNRPESVVPASVSAMATSAATTTKTVLVEQKSGRYAWDPDSTDLLELGAAAKPGAPQDRSPDCSAG